MREEVALKISLPESRVQVIYSFISLSKACNSDYPNKPILNRCVCADGKLTLQLIAQNQYTNLKYVDSFRQRHEK